MFTLLPFLLDSLEMKRVWENKRIVIKRLMTRHMKYASDPSVLSQEMELDRLREAAERQVSFGLKGDLSNSRKHPAGRT